jgi:membrane-bound metal-dependent hydrolase YbcI (DUF457 family)
MDTITHGIAGALLGKAFFANDSRSAPADTATRIAGRVTITAATLGSLFPDGDSIRSTRWFDGNGLAVITNHRAETHSFLLLPLWALALAWLTCAVCRGRGWPAPSLAKLTAIYGVGIASHILLDLITSFGTMILAPLNYGRYQWDLAFILDFILTGIVLLPQLAAWVFRKREGSIVRGAVMWALCAAFAYWVRWLAVRNHVEFSVVALIVVASVLAAIFFLPHSGSWGFRVTRRQWCRAGAALLAVYLCATAAANLSARSRVEAFAVQRGLTVQNLAALPMPPWMARWSGLIRTPQGVYYAPINLLSREAPEFTFIADSPPSAFSAEGETLPEVQAYLRFARFPVTRSFEAGPLHIVEFSDYRFFRRQSGQRGRVGFTYRVTMDAQGNVVSRGWVD